MRNNTIEVKLNSYGGIDVVSVPVKLTKDSYKVIKVRVNAPSIQGSIIKMYTSDTDEAGEQVWTSDAYSLPYKQSVSIDGVEYFVYEDYLPQEFCAEGGDVNITFAQVVIDENNAEQISTSGTLTLFVSGEGFNYNGVQISKHDVLAGKVNEILEDYVVHQELEDAQNETKAELQANIDDLRDIVNEKEKATAYNSYSEMVSILNSADKTLFNIGQSIFIKTLSVPDLWVYDVLDNSSTFSYVSDDDIAQKLEQVGTITVGHFVLAKMETRTIDIENYVNLTSDQNIAGKKRFTGTLDYSNNYTWFEANNRHISLQKSAGYSAHVSRIDIEPEYVYIGMTDNMGSHYGQSGIKFETNTRIGTYNGSEITNSEKLATEVTALETKINNSSSTLQKQITNSVSALEKKIDDAVAGIEDEIIKSLNTEV